MAKAQESCMGMGKAKDSKASAASTLNSNTRIVISGIAKVFVGELVEEGT